VVLWTFGIVGVVGGRIGRWARGWVGDEGRWVCGLLAKAPGTGSCALIIFDLRLT